METFNPEERAALEPYLNGPVFALVNLHALHRADNRLLCLSG